MSATLPSSHAQQSVASKNFEDEMPKVPWGYVMLATVALGIIAVIYRWYQQNYSFTVGLDYFEPEFQTYWMNLFWAQLVLISVIGAVAIPALWFTREKDLQSISPREELNRYYWMLGLMSGGSVLALIALAVFTEADAAWHQVTIRDTDFTPTHIALFYFWIPLLAVGLILGFMWVHTRLPDFSNRVSVPMAILAGGPILIMPNLGLNEWGHTFFYAEELFAAPIHWGFVALAWSIFAMGGFLLQCLNRIKVLSALPDQEKVSQ